MDRREFLKKVHQALIIAGGSSFFTFSELEALENGEMKKPDIIWLQSLSCDGCSTCLVSSDIPMIDIITKFCNIIYHPTLMAATGDNSLKMLEEFKSDNLLFILEGSIPYELPHACLMGEKFMSEWVKLIANKSTACIGAGTCAVFNGITDMKGMYTGAVTLKKFLELENIQKPIVNLPSCPMKPEHFLYVIFFWIKHQKLPPMDLEKRPLRFFGNTVHERCVYYYDYQENIFAKKIGDRGCLFKLGCQGPVTKNDCIRSSNFYDKYNCIKQGHPCIGCSSENFPRTIMLRRSDDDRKIEKYKDFKRI